MQCLPPGLAAKDYENAIKFYSQAIELNPNSAIYYGNRSLAYLRTECYGYALADATRAIELDKKYIKGYYRRAASNMALGKFRAALRDYETVRDASSLLTFTPTPAPGDATWEAPEPALRRFMLGCWLSQSRKAGAVGLAPSLCTAPALTVWVKEWCVCGGGGVLWSHRIVQTGRQAKARGRA